MSSLLIAIPVLNRPERADAVVESIRRAETVRSRIMFLVSPGDAAQEAACRATGEETIVVGWERGRGDYARKINLSAEISTEEWVFTGADDLRFTVGWDARALAAAENGALVIGTDDRCNRRTKIGQHSTHSLVRRRYIEEQTGTIDRSGAIYHPGYWHNFCDDELVQTARARGCWRFSGAIVEHHHFMNRKAPMDSTYEIGQEHFGDDRRLFVERRKLWS